MWWSHWTLLLLLHQPSLQYVTLDFCRCLCSSPVVHFSWTLYFARPSTSPWTSWNGHHRSPATDSASRTFRTPTAAGEPTAWRSIMAVHLHLKSLISLNLRTLHLAALKPKAAHLVLARHRSLPAIHNLTVDEGLILGAWRHRFHLEARWGWRKSQRAWCGLRPWPWHGWRTTLRATSLNGSWLQPKPACGWMHRLYLRDENWRRSRLRPISSSSSSDTGTRTCSSICCATTPTACRSLKYAADWLEIWWIWDFILYSIMCLVIRDPNTMQVIKWLVMWSLYSILRALAPLHSFLYGNENITF